MSMRWALCAVMAALTGCHLPMRNNLPPAAQLDCPGPGVGGPGPGVMMMGPQMPMAVNRSSQVAFVGPEGASVSWDATGGGNFDSEPIIFPGRYNFGQGAIYRLKLTNVPGRPGIELYPTIEIAPTLPRTDAYLEHNAVPFQLTEEDFDQVLAGNFVTKVIYLPDAEYQELALAGVETLVSTRLDPGVDPIVEADRRGAILAIIRLGNKDLEVPGGQQLVGGQGMDGQMTGGPVPIGGPMPMGGGAPMGAMIGDSCQGGGMLPPGVAGATGPQYGMPITGTPIGLPGPPHIPLGIPAGLQQHVIRNHTFTHIPPPTSRVRVDVKQRPGISYPAPANRVRITENAAAPWGSVLPPLGKRFQRVSTGAACPAPDANCQ